MAGDRLRAVPAAESSAPPSPRSSDGPDRFRLASILLAGALMISLVLLAWSRTQLGGRIESLERESRVMEEKLEGRQQVIRAHQGRLDAIRGQLGSLQELLDEPLPDAP